MLSLATRDQRCTSLTLKECMCSLILLNSVSKVLEDFVLVLFAQSLRTQSPSNTLLNGQVAKPLSTQVSSLSSFTKRKTKDLVFKSKMVSYRILKDPSTQMILITSKSNRLKRQPIRLSQLPQTNLRQSWLMVVSQFHRPRWGHLRQTSKLQGLSNQQSRLVTSSSKLQN